jgi:hypothetical protein
MWVQLIVSIVMMVISYAIQSSIKPTSPEAQAGKLDIPTVEEGKSISVVFGTCLVKSSTVAWYGDPSTEAIRSGGGGGKK